MRELFHADWTVDQAFPGFCACHGSHRTGARRHSHEHQYDDHQFRELHVRHRLPGELLRLQLRRQHDAGGQCAAQRELRIYRLFQPRLEPVDWVEFGNSATGSGAPWNFQDNILFDTTGASVQAEASALLTNVTDLQIRIISLNNPATGNPFNITSAANASTLLGGSGVVTVENGWTNFIAGPTDYTATMLNAIPAGDYILQVRGEAQAGSSYTGSIAFTAVPLPSALIMLLSGLGLLGMANAVSRRNGPMSGSLPTA